MDGHTNATKLTVAFRNFAKVSNEKNIISYTTYPKSILNITFYTDTLQKFVTSMYRE